MARDSGAQLPLAAALIAYATLLAFVTFAHPFSDFAYTAVTDVAGVLPPMLAGAIALLAAGRSVAHVRLGWRFIGAGCLAWSLGEVVWTVYEVGIRHEIPFPSAADAGYLAMLPLVAIGLVTLSSERRRLAGTRPTLDALALILTATAFVWFFVLRPTYTESSAGLLEKVIGAAYPVGDLVVAYALAVAVQRHWGFRNAVVLTTLLAGMLLLVAADVGFAYLTLEDTYSEQSLVSSFVNLGWPFGFLLMAYAAALGAGWTLSYETDANLPSPRPWRDALPLALLPPLLALVVVAFRQEALATSIPLVSVAGLVVVAVVVRSAISLGVLRELAASRRQLIVWIAEIRERRQAA